MNREQIIKELDYAPCEAFLNGTQVELTKNVILDINSIFDYFEKELENMQIQKDMLVSFHKEVERKYLKEIDQLKTNEAGLKRRLNKSSELLKNLNKSCNDCIHKNNKENYDLECMECCRFYGDRFESI